ncbi:MAG: ubiquinol-cytochrome C reductase [Rhizobiales bacterium TMED249]|nr:MAG: ubiquinol-cytochrome C reductase [Rhizobiales bacterium TMED249]HAK98082.1 EVE domain-containing protein [Rhodobiaceae bacterium]|tara:strand:+ start:149 stop:592 length:444 start_codon:yes stop_codon:yes gene_type:complete
MAYWLFKSEPGNWSWDNQCARGKKGEHWDGVRNFLANKQMKNMKLGDKGFFYHSVNEKRIMGTVEVIKEHYPDHTDESGRFGMVDIVALQSAEKFVTLADIKAEEKFADMVLVNNSRLSVQPVTATEWKFVCEMAGLDPSGKTQNAF